MHSTLLFSVFIFLALGASFCSALPPDFRLDEVKLLGPKQTEFTYFPGFTLAVDKSDGRRFVSGSIWIQGPPPPVFVYEASADFKWQRVQEINAPDGFFGMETFGASVSIHGDDLAIGAPDATSANYPGVQGFVFLYKRTALSWSLPLSLSILPNPKIADELCRFGRALSLHSGRLLVGCTPTNNAINPSIQSNSSGVGLLFSISNLAAGAQEFDTISLNPGQRLDVPTASLCSDIAVLASSNPANGYVTIEIRNLVNGHSYLYSPTSSRSGLDLDCDGTSVLVGLPGSAVLLVFSESTNMYVVEQSFGPGTSAGTTYGRTVALWGTRALVSAPTGQGKTRGTGLVYSFSKDSGAWDGGIITAATDGQSSGQFGLAVALTANQIIVGGFGSGCETCDFTQPAVAYVYSQSNSCGVPPIPNAATICSELLSLYYFNPQVSIDTPVTLINPVVITGNLSVGANVTTYVKGDQTPLTALSCLSINSGSVEIHLDGPNDGIVTVAKSKCLAGEFATVNLTRSSGDCRRYKIKGQQKDEVSGSLNVILDVDASRCSNTKIIVGSVVGGVAFIAILVGIGVFLAYRLRIRALNKIWQADNDLDDPLMAHL